MTASDRLVDALQTHDCGPRKSGGSWSARCPAHEDRNPSLSLRQIEGQALLYCHAGCATADVLAVLELSMRDLFDEPTGATYRYDDGRIVHRTPDKQFPQSGNRQGDALYRRAQVVAAIAAGRTIWCCEGEKDVHTLEELGAVATCNPMGATNWHKVDPSPLYGGTVTVVVDNDEAGQKWAGTVRDSLGGKVKSLSFVQAKTGKDAADHYAAGHGLDEFVPIESPICQRRLVLTLASSIRPERQRWLWSDRIPLDALCLLAGREGLGKSTIATDLAAQVTRGDVDGELHGQPRDVLIVATEDNKATTIVPRLIAANADMDRVHFVNAEVDGFTGQPVFPTDTTLLAGAIEETKAALVILDAATSVIDGALDGDRDRQMRQALEPLGRIAGQNACSILGIVHFGKRADADTGKLILGSIAWSQVARAVVAVARDDDSGDLLIQPTKHNLAPGDTPALLARLVPHYVETDDGPTSVGRVEWLGETDAQATDHLGRRDDPDDRTERDEAVDWLLDYLDRNGGEAGAGDAIKAAARDGIARTTLTRARQRAGVRSVKSGMDAGWVWQLNPEESTKNPKGSRTRARDSSVPSVDSSGAPESSSESPETGCGHPVNIQALNGKCALCLAAEKNAQAQTSRDAFTESLEAAPSVAQCPTCGTELWPDGLCVTCEVVGGSDAA
ncbi:MAG: AAA family ATPase [Nocardioidaceae bacterium]